MRCACFIPICLCFQDKFLGSGCIYLNVSVYDLSAEFIYFGFQFFANLLCRVFIAIGDSDITCSHISCPDSSAFPGSLACIICNSIVNRSSDFFLHGTDDGLIIVRKGNLLILVYTDGVNSLFRTGFNDAVTSISGDLEDDIRSLVMKCDSTFLAFRRVFIVVCIVYNNIDIRICIFRTLLVANNKVVDDIAVFAKKIELASVDDLFSTEEGRQDAKLEKIQEIPLSELHPFRNHPFKVKDDEAMMETADSIKQYGVLVPAIARPDPEGGYELVAGHRRHRASELADKETMPVIVRDLDDDAATIIMVDSNLQRESLLPSERAFAYKMKLDAMKHQGERVDLTSSQVGTKLRADEILAQQAGSSRNQVQRYIRLTELIPELMDNIRVVGCWAHARRKFDEALQTLPKEAQKNSPAAMGERYYSRLFKLGQALAELIPEERHKKRLEQEKPVLDALLSWANEMQAKTAPKS